MIFLTRNLIVSSIADMDVVPISGNTPGGSIVGIALNSGSILGITPGKGMSLEKRSVRDMAANFNKMDNDVGTA